MSLFKHLKSHWFSLAMLGLFFIAWVAPSLPAWINSGGYAKIAAIMIIFFFSGLSLKTEEIAHGFTNWRLHLAIQGFCYLFLPLFTWILLSLFGGGLHEGLIIGFSLLAVLPITISSCVVFTQLAEGNFAAALFNAVLGNVMGIVVSPALFLLMLGTTDISIELDTMRIITRLGMLVVAPLIVGQVVHVFVKEHTKKLKKIGSVVNRWCILLIVYFAFGQIFTGDAIQASFTGMILPLLLIVPYHLVILWFTWAGGRLFRFSPPDRIAMLFCASQKTLAMGLPLIAAVMAARPNLEGLATLPVIIYHPIQLLVAGFLVERLQRQK